MGGKGSGRKKGTKFGSYESKPSSQLSKLKRTGDDTLIRMEGHEIERTAKRYRHYAYNKGGKKYHSLISNSNPEFSYRGIPEEQYQAHLKRLGKNDSSAYEKLWVYSKEGSLWRAENTRKGLISRIENEFTGEFFNINGKRYSMVDVILELNKLQNTQTWIDLAENNKEAIGEYWDKYHSETGIAPPPDAGELNYFDDETTDIDSSIQDQEHEAQKANMERLLSRMIK